MIHASGRKNDRMVTSVGAAFPICRIAALRQSGGSDVACFVRCWESSIKRDLEGVVRRIALAVEKRAGRRSYTGFRAALPR
jgi:hypothetical protein